MSLRSRWIPFALLLLCGGAMWTASTARAEFGPVQLVSKSAVEQAAEAVDPAISADGRYVAFAGQLGGREGVFRKDLQTGAVAVVVTFEGTPVHSAAMSANPSISGDGRYVAFTCIVFAILMYSLFASV